MQLPNPKARAALIALAPWLALPAMGSPFGTVDSPSVLHQHNEHQMITRLAFRCPDGQKSDGICFEPRSLDQLAGVVGDNGAVGSPDTLPPEGPEAHCDDADFLDIPNYPQSRVDATAALQRCVTFLRTRFIQGINGAGRMVDADNKLITRDITIGGIAGPCVFSHRSTTDDTASVAKCVALEGLGRALHGAEDFYAHSNWADQADPNSAISVVNPPGLGNTSPAPFLDLRSTSDITSLVPRNLTTGCFNVAEMLPGNGGTGSFGCRNRIAHLNVNKDHGVINLDGTVTADPSGVPRNAVAGNFARAVSGAVNDARERWRNFRDELQIQHGAEKANLLICAIVRDDPAKDCRNRKISIVIDSSGSNSWTDPSNLRIQAGKDFNAKLTTAAQAGAGSVPDQVAVIDFDTSATVLYPMGDPAAAASTFDAIDSSGGTDIGSGISAGIDEIMKDEPGLFANRAGIIVLTDGEDGNPANQIAQFVRARLQGIRVNYGFLSPPVNPIPKRSLVKRAPAPDIIAGILSTGGTFGIIESAQAQKNFIKLVLARGTTGVDAAVGSSILISGVTVTENVTPAKTSHYFAYSAASGEHMNFTVTVSSGTEPLTAVLRSVRENKDIDTLTPVVGSPSTVSYDASGRTELELIVSMSPNATSDVVFSVGMDTNMPEKNETTSTPPILSSTIFSSASSTPVANTTTPSFNFTSTPITMTSHTTTPYPTGYSSSYPHGNSSEGYYQSSSKPGYSQSGVVSYTKVYTSICYTTKEETTVYDNDETRTLSVYPTSRYTSVITTTVASYPAHTTPAGYPVSEKTSPSSATYELDWDEYLSTAYECLKSGISYPSQSAPAGYSYVKSGSKEYPSYTSAPNPYEPASYPSGPQSSGYAYSEKSEYSSVPAYPEEPEALSYPGAPDASSYPTPVYTANPQASPYTSGPGYPEQSPAPHVHSHATIPVYEQYGSSLPGSPPSAPAYPVPSSPAAPGSESYPSVQVSPGAEYTKVTVTVVSAQTHQPPTPAVPAIPTSGTYTYPNATISFGKFNSTSTTTGVAQYTGGAESVNFKGVVGLIGAVVAVVGYGGL
ncbi:hypothetical protein K458DRAFT_431769 [Lentithecium fluviatile CBS 122367]|uniref:VWFA domain-containing protein n=1 Tax=Lentithecium fluviatile CBS 122367 TaxID=1168545 RepID=A0A6G1J1C8_9PLEO|nr:hypothetical protein K458DRAFT_431769 [Lentithecium fluviatile CBS 122367]